MVTLRSLALLVAALAFSAGTAEAGKGGKKNGSHELHGTVVSVQAGGFTLKTGGKKGGKGKGKAGNGAGNAQKAGEKVARAAGI